MWDLLIYGCAGSLLLCGLFSSSGTWASHPGSFSSCRARALGHSGLVIVAPGQQSADLVVVVHRLSCSTARGIFPDQGANLCLLHWPADSLPLSH